MRLERVYAVTRGVHEPQSAEYAAMLADYLAHTPVHNMPSRAAAPAKTPVPSPRTPASDCRPSYRDSRAGTLPISSAPTASPMLPAPSCAPFVSAYASREPPEPHS